MTSRLSIRPDYRTVRVGFSKLIEAHFKERSERTSRVCVCVCWGGGGMGGGGTK